MFEPSIGHGAALGAATVLNAVANWKGSAFGVSLRTEAFVELDLSGSVVGNMPGIDTRLIVRCVQLVLQRFGLSYGGVVRTKSEIPVASGLKSSSAAANAAVLATLDAIGETINPLDAARIGVHAAREVGVTITGAFDDAAASMLGGFVVTDNREDKLLRRDCIDSKVLLLAPDEQMFSSTTDVRRSMLLSCVADIVFDHAIAADYERAMIMNGLMYCAALKRSPEPILSAIGAGARAASLSGTGPSYAALVDEKCMHQVEAAWKEFGGRVIKTEVNNRGAML
jgi:shikimate kinase